MHLDAVSEPHAARPQPQLEGARAIQDVRALRRELEHIGVHGHHLGFWFKSATIVGHDSNFERRVAVKRALKQDRDSYENTCSTNIHRYKYS